MAAVDLIDTQWNVNAFVDISGDDEYIDLIDTQWNVNYQNKVVDLSLLRFNRYIVECKFTIHISNIEMTIGFNRYIVECKF